MSNTDAFNPLILIQLFNFLISKYIWNTVNKDSYKLILEEVVKQNSGVVWVYIY